MAQCQGTHTHTQAHTSKHTHPSTHTSKHTHRTRRSSFTLFFSRTMPSYLTDAPPLLPVIRQPRCIQTGRLRKPFLAPVGEGYAEIIKRPA